jgi:hypothetical protein
MKIVFVITLSLIYLCCTQAGEEPIRLTLGPHLFIDEYLIANHEMLSRTVNQPQKHPLPVVTGGENGDQNFQPYMTVLKDEDTGNFRLWYNTPVHTKQSHIGYIESKDGINWIRPHRVLKDPHMIKFGVSVVDRGVDFADPVARFLFAAYMLDGLMISTSADGFEWQAIKPQSVLKHNHDITSLHWDPIRKHYLAIVSVWNQKEKNQRTPHQSVSKDLLNWEEIRPIMNGKIGAPIEKGETQFYAMSGVITRGDLMIGLVKILRDDLNATPGKTGKEMGDLNRKAAGLGYTVLAWSRDGETWHRDHEPFISQNPVPGTWDHAMAWGDEQIIVGDETFIYYGGYARGHKVDRFNERQIGLTRMPRDRYVAREASINMGTLLTKPVTITSESMTVNALVFGEMQIRLIDNDNAPISGYYWIDLSGDSISHSSGWMKNLTEIHGKPVRIEFQLKNAQLFGFSLL